MLSPSMRPSERRKSRRALVGRSSLLGSLERDDHECMHPLLIIIAIESVIVGIAAIAVLVAFARS